jgi:hypothetical protein
MPNSRREFIRKSILLSGAAGLNVPYDLSEKQFRSVDGDRLVLLGTQGGPLIRSYNQNAICKFDCL